MLGAKDRGKIIGRKFADFLARDYAEAIGDFIEALAMEDGPFPAKMLTLHGNEAAVIMIRDVTQHNRAVKADAG